MDYSSAGRLREDSMTQAGTKVTITKSRKRPQSRASTASVQSSITQPHVDPINRVADYQNNWYDRSPQAQQSLGSANHQISPEEDMVIRSVSHLQDPTSYEIDPDLVSRGNHDLTYPQESHYRPESARQLHPDEVYAHNYGEPDSQMVEGRSDEQDDVESAAGANGAGKKGAKTSAANELEMRALFHANKHRSLPEVAKELHGNERGPQSERQRQVFAMLWINQVCAKGKGSVPRSRVYSYYVTRCATERVTVLNPASFGKLVRVLFPGLKTRRLGVRGESKYHYVNFSLEEDQPSMGEVKQEQPLHSFQDQPILAQNLNLSYHAQYPVDRAAFPPLIAPQPSRQAIQQTQGFIRPHSLYSQPQTEDLSHMEMSTIKVSQRLGFASLMQPPAQEYEPLALPKIEPFVPAGTDLDAATALTALYRSHCTSLVECVRFCKEKTFFHLFTSFHGTLTMPVQKLFAHPSVAPWIEECDFVMYQKMVRVASHLTLQVAPPAVLATLKSISQRLVPHIRSSFNGQPGHVLNAKVAPATLFAGLLDRELRVNLTAHAAANMLVNQQNRDQMYLDWITLVRTRKIAECVPTRGMDDLVTLFLTELRGLLEPLSVPWDLESGTLYGQMAARNGRNQQAAQHDGATQENTLDRWVNFLISLPQKFPYATHAEILWGVQQVGTAVMRDITMEQGKSFAAWWVTKCWIDEMIAFLVEQGGFMEYKTSHTTHVEASKQAQSKARTPLEGRYSTASDDFLQENQNVNAATSVPGQMDMTSPDNSNAAAAHDDSGIGIRTPEDDFAIEKYAYAQG